MSGDYSGTTSSTVLAHLSNPRIHPGNIVPHVEDTIRIGIRYNLKTWSEDESMAL